MEQLTMYSFPKNKRGFSLLEVLVTLVILAVGLLGVAALQATGMRFNTISAQRSIAAIQINNFMTKMRANICGVHSTNPALIDPASGDSIGDAYVDCDTPTDDAFSYRDYSSEAVMPGPPDVPYTHTAINTLAPGTTCTTLGSACNSATQAQADLIAFSTDVATSLSGGAVRITCNDDLDTGTANDCTNNSTYEVAVFWQETASALDDKGQTTGAAITQNFAMVFRP